MHVKSKCEQQNLTVVKNERNEDSTGKHVLE